MSLGCRTVLSSLLFITTCSLSPVFASNPHHDFSAGEHVTIGDNVKLYFHEHDAGQTGKSLHLANGLTLSYGDLISFGDYYGVPNESIAYGKTDAERKQRFQNAFNQFSQDSTLIAEARQIIAVVHDEQNALRDGMQRGERPEEIYKKWGTETSRKINCITGGGCVESTWWLYPGRSLNLTSDNYDHFGANAWIAYKAGHEAALEQALIAGQHRDIKGLEIAYAMNAFACHFLSDRFASGHIRVPREELPANVTPAVVGTLLAGIMHNEESPVGIHVHNTRGDRWIAYGDKSYFEHKNNEHKKILQETLQASANQIFTAYLWGKTPAQDPVYNLVPQPDENGNDSIQDVSPLFYWDAVNKQLMRRKNTANLYDRHWTSDWWGWSTLIELGGEKGIPPTAQAALIRAGLGQQALSSGLIRDKDMVNYLRHQ
jgi:hypothetical protein